MEIGRHNYTIDICLNRGPDRHIEIFPLIDSLTHRETGRWGD